MKKYLLFFSGLILLIVLTRIAFADTKIKTEVDKNKLTTDEFLTYKLSIISDERRIPAPRIPEFVGFDIVSQAQSSTTSFEKSGFTNIIIYEFILAPNETGIFRIESSQITLSGRAYQTEEFTIEVTRGLSKPSVPKQEKPTLQTEEPKDKLPKITL